MRKLISWQRLEYEDIPVYLHPERPDWAVPDPEADFLLKKGLQQEPPSSLEENFHLTRLASQLEAPPKDVYSGRADHLTLEGLQECWFHLTNRCNLSCRHCLFASSPASRDTLSRDVLNQALNQACDLGCRLFYFTGGEPLIYPDFSKIVSDILQRQECHVVILTNGLLLENHIQDLISLPSERLHFQISLDGMENQHDILRGSGSFQKVMTALDLIREAEIQTTLSIALNRYNLKNLTDLVELASAKGIHNLHLMYHFVRGKGSQDQFVSSEEIFGQLRLAYERGIALGVSIDNVETIRSQVFSVPGHKHDLSNAGWQSLAIGPTGEIYPSPALVGMEKMGCGSVDQGLENVWRHSKLLNELRESSLRGTDYEKNPFKFLIGGGDIDHSVIHSGEFAGHDPYSGLYNLIALHLIREQASKYPARNRRPEFLLKMGEVRTDCPEDGKVSLTHCNCVISLADQGGRSSIREFYAAAAEEANTEIVNPFLRKETGADFIPENARQRSYGCGSPVQDAGLTQGEILVDLGSGSGTECFQAAEKVGPEGKVIGVDMTREMITLANESRPKVAEKLGYDNTEFRHGFLEDLPLEDQSADVIISNCVINLSPDKRQTLHEAFRILKPGGRLVVSDIVSDNPVPPEIKNNPKLRGECLGGAFTLEDLMGMLSSAGFSTVKLRKRFPYRQIGGTSFYSLTFSARKPSGKENIEVIYRGPFAAVTTEGGQILLKGRRTRIWTDDPTCLDESVFVLDSRGVVKNLDQGDSCCATSKAATSCCPEQADNKEECCPAAPLNFQTGRDCLVCGEPLVYFESETRMNCHACGKIHQTPVCCRNEHFVCDDCHQAPALTAIRKNCTETGETDMIRLLDHIRRQPGINLHGPEHHAMVPGIILATYRNLGGQVNRSDILKAVNQGSRVPGGTCGLWGACGAAIGVGIGFSILLQSTPLQGKARQQVMQACSRILAGLGEIPAPRCCQRETWLALKEASRLSERFLPLALQADFTLKCRQYEINRECVRRQCPLWQSRSKQADGMTILPLAGQKPEIKN